MFITNRLSKFYARISWPFTVGFGNAKSRSYTASTWLLTILRSSVNVLDYFIRHLTNTVKLNSFFEYNMALQDNHYTNTVNNLPHV